MRYLVILLSMRFAVVEASNIDNVFELTLEQLLDLEVTTVSRRSELLREAPGVVSVITAADISAFGARNIRDVLQRIPNFYSFDSQTWSASAASLRAGATQHLNNHILILFNGRPLRESQNGGLHTDINLLFPVTAIERIEVIRGPSSVLYGSNAFNGTINIITKEPEEGLATSLSGQYGSYQYTRHTAAIAKGFAGGGSAQLQLTKLEENGATLTAYDESGVLGSQVRYRDGANAFFTADYGGFSVNSILSTITLPILGGNNLWSNEAELQLQRQYVDVSYEYILSSSWKAELYYTYNRQERTITPPELSPRNGLDLYANDSVYEASLSGVLGENLNVLLGAVRDQLQGDLDVQGGEYQSKRDGAYAQMDYRISDPTKVTLGLQWNKLEGLDANISPRLALIHSINTLWSTKFLYAEAFRSPYGTEMFFDSVFLKGDTELKPELISTSEFQILYGRAGHSFTATFYHSETENTIGRLSRNRESYFVNSNAIIHAKGLELEARLSLSPKWQVQGNYSYQVNKNQNGIMDLMPASGVMAKLGLAYQTLDGVQVGLWNSYFGDVSKLEDNLLRSVRVVNPEAKAYSLLSLNVNLNLATLLAKPRLEGLELAVFANNILNEDVWFPELSRLEINTYPQPHARGVYASFAYSF